MNKVLNVIIWPMAALAMVLFSCAEDDMRTTTNAEGDALVQLILKLPGAGNGSSTRAITEPPGDENKIDEVDVLAFINNGTDWVYDYTATFVDISPMGSDPNHLIVTATVRGLSQKQRFVILANSSSELGEARLIRGETLEQIDKKIISKTGNGEWPPNNGANDAFVPFPMYALTKEVLVGTDTPDICPMIRAVARIDVTLKDGLEDFVLDGAYLLNYKKAGYISYGNSNFSDTPPYYVTTPAVPPEGNHTGSSILGTGTYYQADKTPPADTRGEIKRAIYTFESEGITSEADKTTKIALVVGGYYNGSPKRTFYRIDLKGTSGTRTLNDILRNHLYKVEIKSVSAPGYNIVEDAYKGHSHLTAEVERWNLASQNVVADKPFFLNTQTDNDGTLYLWEQNSPITVTAETDYDPAIYGQTFPKGILNIDESAIKYDLSESKWLTITSGVGGAGSLKRTFILNFNKSMVPTTMPPTSISATIPITAGNLTQTISVQLELGYYPKPHSGWAGSNIYYAPGIGLTFDAVGVTDNQQCQGVLFKWGSLTGISPTGDFPGGVSLFPLGILSLNRVPWNTIRDAGVNTIALYNYADRGYLYEITDEPNGIGDICKYLTQKGMAPEGNWRMPVASEFNESYTLTGTFASQTSSHASGLTHINSYATINGGYPVFPASGFRQVNNGTLVEMGKSTYYWSGSTDGSVSYALRFPVNGSASVVSIARQNAFPIRCVRE